MEALMPQSQSNTNSIELNRALSKSYIHYDPNRTDYTISEAELSQIEEYGNSVWKEIFSATLGLGVPSLINAIVAQYKLKSNEAINGEIVINYIVGFSSLVICVFCLIAWRVNKKKHLNIIRQIQNKPKYTLPNTQT
jgi:hypothetical protein